jgi:hypothetical protein
LFFDRIAAEPSAEVRGVMAISIIIQPHLGVEVFTVEFERTDEIWRQGTAAFSMTFGRRIIVFRMCASPEPAKR